MELLKFTAGNAKLDKFTGIFSLPAGHSCPAADICLSKSDRTTGSIKDGKKTVFRCYAASSEAISPAARKMRWHNFELLRKLKRTEAAKLIIDSIVYTGLSKSPRIRVHASGDFFNEEYFLAWMDVARVFNKITFYAYTKSLNIWVKHMDVIPKNFHLNASKGGRFDSLIEEYDLKFVEVVYSEEEAKKKKLKIDHTDELAYTQKKSFALILHGAQPKDSEASKALSLLRKKGIGGYSRKKKVV